MFVIQYVMKLIKILRSAASPPQIAGGFIIGMIIGLSPSFLTLTNLFWILILIILNVNIATAIFAMVIFEGIAYLLDPVFHSLGYWLLVEVQGLRGVWTSMYNAPVIPFTRFNNTVYLGSFLVALVLFLPVYFSVKKLVVIYREKYEPRVKNWKWVKFLKATNVYKLYEQFKFIGE